MKAKTKHYGLTVLLSSAAVVLGLLLGLAVLAAFRPELRFMFEGIHP